MGIVPISFPESEHLYLLYPCYHMPINPQNTLGGPALKHYNQARSVKTEVLAWFRVVSKEEHSSHISTIPTYHKLELQDYVNVNIHIFPTDMATIMEAGNHHPKISKSTSTTAPIPTFLSEEDKYSMSFRVELHESKVDSSFSKHDFIDWSILHRRFDHIKDEN